MRDFKRQGLGGAAHFRERHQQIGEPDPYRLVAGNAPAGVEQQRRLLHADQPRQGCGQAEAGVKTESIEIGAEARLLTGNTEIGHQRETEASSNRGAVHRGDDGLPGTEEADCFFIEVSAGAAAAALRCRSRFHALREIGPGAEGAAFRRQHDRPAARVGVEPFERFAYLADQVAVEEIVRRPAHLDGGDIAILADLGVAHLRFSSRVRFTISASTTVRPCPCGWTMTGLRSISSISSK